MLSRAFWWIVFSVLGSIALILVILIVASMFIGYWSIRLRRGREEAEEWLECDYFDIGPRFTLP